VRILFIVHQFMPEFAAGTERVTLNLAKSAQRDGHQVEVITSSLREGSLWSGVGEDGVRFAAFEGIPVHGLPAHHMTILAQLGIDDDGQMERAFARFLDGRRPYDLVHITHPMRMLGAIDSVRTRNIPYIVTLTDFFFLCHRVNLVQQSGRLCPGPAGGEACKVHCPLPNIDPKKLNARQQRMSTILHSAFDIVACSPFVASRFEAELPSLPIRVIGHGIDLLQFGRPSRTMHPHRTVFGYLGTISEAKGVRALAEAFAGGAPADARLDLVGPSYDNEQLIRDLRALAKSDQRIRIKPAVPADQVPRALGKFDVLCLPSLVPETFSLALHEGFAAGLPCIVSDLGHPAEVVRWNRCGEALPPNDIAAWNKAISRIAGNPSILAGWKRNVPMPLRVEEEAFLYSHLYQIARQVERRMD
jgi:glycosyltransferase involved in cell wall biosynthesis